MVNMCGFLALPIQSNAIGAAGRARLRRSELFYVVPNSTLPHYTAQRGFSGEKFGNEAK
jgi:hypothetical protein